MKRVSNKEVNIALIDKFLNRMFIFDLFDIGRFNKKFNSLKYSF